MQSDFMQTLHAYYDAHRRDFLPWRQNLDPYHILVSEIMLQQTQVGRVIPKYEAFLQAFPDIKSLAEAPLADVLRSWQGLGYNRRAKYLHEAAKIVTSGYGDTIPGALDDLVKLPGVGVNTAGAILVYSFNMPVVFIETNIRTVLLHHFYPDSLGVSDKQLADTLRSLVPADNPRDFYWALMDYGTYLKSRTSGIHTRAKSYTKQSRFEGSDRQIRGRILRILASGSEDETALLENLADERSVEILSSLEGEGLIERSGDVIRLAGSCDE